MDERAGRQRRPAAALRRFLIGYLHQDFALEHGSAEGGARAYAAAARPAERRRAAAQLRRVIEESDGLEPLRAALSRLGCGWRPPDLEAVRAVLALFDETEDGESGATRTAGP